MTNINMGTNKLMIIAGLIGSLEEKDDVEEVVKIFTLGKRMRNLSRRNKRINGKQKKII
jgi:hypothetical protein